MGLVRKPKSKRVRIKDMERWKRKAKENKRKARRDAKRNPQWKSRVKKDPGVPNSFPFKDLILAEAEQARVLELEEKHKMKELKASDIAQLSGLSVVDPSRISTAAVIDDTTPEDEEEAPALLEPDLPDLDAAINKADLVIQVLDSRDPLSYRVPSFEKTLAERGKRLVFVLNKTELVPREAVSAWLSHLRLEHPTFPFRPSTAFLTSIYIPATPKGKEKAPVDDELGAIALREYITTLAKEKKSAGGGSAPFVVAITGMTNTGKSAIINSLLHEESQKVYRIRVGDDPNSRTTVYPHRVPSNQLSVEDGLDITLIDTPGFTFKLPMDVTDEELTELKVKETLFHRRGLFEKMKHPLSPASWVLLRTNPEDIQVLYNAQAFEANDLEAMIKSLGRASGRLSRSGKADKDSTASMILRDWRQGKLGIYTFPPKSSLSTILNANPTTTPLKDLYQRTDSLVLDKLAARAEMIASPHGSSVVRFKVGEPWPGGVSVDLHARCEVGGEDEVALDGPRTKRGLANGDKMDVDDDEDDEDDDEDDEMGDDQSDEDDKEGWTGFESGNNSDSASSGDQDSDEDSELSPPPKSKSKRRASPNALLEPALPKASKSKRVAFASSVAPPASAASRPGSAKGAKPSKTSLKKATQEAAKERSRAAAAKFTPSKPPTKSTTPTEKKSSLKVANEPSAARQKALASAAASNDPSEQPYDFSLHFR